MFVIVMCLVLLMCTLTICSAVLCIFMIECMYVVVNALCNLSVRNVVNPCTLGVFALG